MVKRSFLCFRFYIAGAKKRRAISRHFKCRRLNWNKTSWSNIYKLALFEGLSPGIMGCSPSCRRGVDWIEELQRWENKDMLWQSWHPVVSEEPSRPFISLCRRSWSYPFSSIVSIKHISAKQWYAAGILFSAFLCWTPAMGKVFHFGASMSIYA